MYKSKPVNILKSLDSKELKRFGLYIISPFFNKNVQVVNLFEHLKKYYPDFKHEQIHREKVFKKVFPKMVYNEQKLRYVMTDLVKLLEDFLTYEEHQNDRDAYEYILMKSLAKRNLSKYFSQNYQAFQKRTEGEGKKNITHHLYQYKLEQLRYYFEPGQNDVNVNMVDNINQSLDYFFVANKLKYACEQANYLDVYKRKTGKKDSFIHLSEIQERLKTSPVKDDPAVIVYQKILQTLSPDSMDKHYEELLEVLEKLEQNFTQSELHDMYIYARNYCIKQTRKGKRIYLQKLLDLFKKLLDKKIILSNGYISQWDYKNIFTVSKLLDELDFAENFIHEYKNYIKPEHRENAFTFNLAHLYFVKKDYAKALQELHQVAFTDPHYHLDTKILMVKCYYELNELIPLFNLIDTFKAFVRKNKQISDVTKPIYTNFLGYVKKLTRIKMGSKKSAKDLQEVIKNDPQLGGDDKLWLVEKITDMVNENKRSWF